MHEKYSKFAKTKCLVRNQKYYLLLGYLFHRIKLIFGTFNCHSSKSPFVLIHRRNLYQKKKTMKSTEHPAPMATQDVAFRDVASLRN